MKPPWFWRSRRRPPERRHRSGRPRRGWLSLPERRLPALPRHASDTGTLPAVQRRQRRISRTITWLQVNIRFLTLLVILLALMASGTGGGLVLSRDWFNNPYRLPAQTAPTQAELAKALLLGQKFISALYKPLPQDQAVQSESSGVPLSAQFPAENDTRVLLGQDTPVLGSNGASYSASSISDVDLDATHDRYTVTFSSPAQADALKFRVIIDWTFTKTSWQLQLRPLHVAEAADIWLDQRLLVEYLPGQSPTYEHVFADANQSLLRTLRFTVRHATQEAYLCAYNHNPSRKAALAQFLTANGYIPGFDLRAPLCQNDLAHLPDDMPVNSQAYPDCRHIAKSSEFAYAYHSKVCLYEGLYILSGERDPFLQAWSALTILKKYHDPNHPLPENHFWMQGGTPAEVAVHLQGMWDNGIPKCQPFACAERSGIRTSVFCALETELGYHYGKQLTPSAAALARRYADAAAKVLVQTQIGPRGAIRASNVTYIRPGQAGSYMESWIANSLRFTNPSTPAIPVAVALVLKGASPTPIEYPGPLASNSETSLDAQSALKGYDCAKYRVCR